MINQEQLDHEMVADEPDCQDCRRRKGLSKIVDRVHLKKTGNVRWLRLCDVCVRDRMSRGDAEIG